VKTGCWGKCIRQREMQQQEGRNIKEIKFLKFIFLTEYYWGG
jgi:hypothetical protein